jgi:predicted nucleotidyltransferase
MASIVKVLQDKKLITPPSFVATNVHYETIMGSVAYGVSSDTSDEDVYGFCIPPKDVLFPHLAGEIPGFIPRAQRFEQYQQHHIKLHEKKEYDITIYNIVKYFKLCMGCNPNMIDSLFTPANCVKHCTKVGNMVRESRKLFLSKKAWHTFKGYSFSQLNKMKTKEFKNSKRRSEIEEYGYSVKFAYHVVRLLNEVEQILTTGDIDLQQDRERLKSIRRGEWTAEQINDLFDDKQKNLEDLYLTSNAVPYSPDEDAIESLLLNCLEEHYGDLSAAVSKRNKETEILKQIKTIILDSGV